MTSQSRRDFRNASLPRPKSHRQLTAILPVLQAATMDANANAPAPASRKPVKPADNIKKGLCEALDAIKPAGSFAAFAKLSHTNIKPILVRDVGHIAYPLQEATARQLIEKARQAPYGKGSETFVDTSVRNTWELDAAQLDLNPLTEKTPGMFGTLIICLPSEHQGGDLVVKHRHVTKTFKSSQSQPSIAWWFSDVTHEVLPVTSGIRWVLTYNLAITHPAQHRPSAAMNTPELDGLGNALNAWLESREASLSLPSLKGADLNRMQCLKAVCGSRNATLFLGVIEKRALGACETLYDEDDYYGEDDYDTASWHSFAETIESEITIKRLVSTDGRTMREDLTIPEDELEERLIQDEEDPFEGAERREEDYSG
ncbi:hypothetical protein SODALDRAFT_282215, partial [Sodiomyces alkalinus F11]